MKTTYDRGGRSPSNRLLVLGGLAGMVAFSALGQGSLTPSGAPAPTMKTLSQVEPRIAVDAVSTPGDSSAQHRIVQPGSYYLTTNIIGLAARYGVSIQTNNVTLDLNGFAIMGVSNAYDGVVIFSGCSNVVVRNGTISGWGTGFWGVRALGSGALMERLVVSGNSFGIQCQHGATVRDCVVNNNQRDGIGVSGVGALVMNNTLASNNQLAGPGNAGLSVLGSQNRIEGNHVTGGPGGSGILITGGLGFTNNIVIRNSVIGFGANNYNTGAGNIMGPLITITGTVTNSNPWANFSF